MQHEGHRKAKKMKYLFPKGEQNPSFKHGRQRSPSWKIWVGVLQRCQDPNSNIFKYYGGRGITVCERWLVFENFLADMGERPAGMSIERNNVNKGYEPGNCRWATKKEQSRNTRVTRWVEWQGKKISLAELSELSTVPYNRLRWRLQRGWPVAEAVDTTDHRL